MKYKVGYLVFVFLWSVCSVSHAQVQFNFNGLGRAIVTTNKLSGPTLNGDTVTPKKGVSGYTLFDLQPNLVIGNTVRANAILRLRNPFGSFYGASTVFAFRQFQIMGKIGKVADYEIGDIYIGGMTKYTVFKPEEIWHDYESDIHAMRRSVVEYENFVKGNMWRLQGVQAYSNFGFNKGIKSLNVRLFGTRTNASNTQGTPDRLLVGGRLGIVQSQYLAVGVNYVGMLDVRVNNDSVDYSNNVLTGDVKLTLDREKFLVQLAGELGTSNFKNTQVYSKVTKQYNDYVTDIDFKAVYKPLKIKVFGAYRSVGAQFTSPAAQTARLNVLQNLSLFETINNATVGRNPTLYDRLTDEGMYNRSVAPVLYMFQPEYGNLSPYGDATPNRTGITAGIGSDTSAKVIQAEARVDLYSELVGEGVADKRKFTSLRGGLRFNLGTLLKWNRILSFNAGARQENTTRGGEAPIDFKSTLIDLGATVETFKKLDLLFGVKLLNAKGNEYLTLRDQFNLINNYIIYNLDMNEAIISPGVRLRFSERSYLTGTYNATAYKDTKFFNYNYKIHQVFFNYTLVF
ncbi:MAG TPA: hypothetical protein VNB90_05050 [Cytophagaceae bacterium]|jgi:hypothetical protein|nr:hypothetical protein [Cytophagaceae bacterium]